MPSERIDGQEFSFQPISLIAAVATDAAPGEALILAVDEGEEDILPFFATRGSLIHTDNQNHLAGYEGVFTSLQQARDHFAAAGVDQAILDAMIR